MNFKKLALTFSVVCLSFLGASHAQAQGTCGHRFGAGVGIVHTDEPSDTSVSVGAEYECRLNALLGLGAFADHVFSDPSFTLVGIPQVLIHPFGGDFFVAGSALFQFGGQGNHVGTRLSTRIPIALAFFVLVPTAAVDFIGGHRNYWFGLGISI